MAIGEFLGKLRNQHGWALRDVASRAGVSHSYLSQVERGKIKQPSPFALHKLAVAYQVDFQTLMAEAGYVRVLEGNRVSPVSFSGAERLTVEQKRLVQQVIDALVESGKATT